VVLDPGPYPFKGEVVWLTGAQGSRRGEAPPVSEEYSYAHVGRVPPHPTQASFVLRGWDPSQWRSRAEGKWLIVANEGEQQVVPGSVVIISEGHSVSGLFFVDQVDDAASSG
jgi:hypothetical protein